MDRWTGSRAAAWPWFVVFFCVVFAVGCQDGSGPNLVTSPEGEPSFEGAKPPPPPPPPAADPAIAFVDYGQWRDGNHWVQNTWFIYVMNADGSNLTTIFRGVPHQTILGRPAWSPDGRRIAFATGGLGDPNPGIWLVDVSVVNGIPTGTNARPFIPYPAWMPAWSPLGDQIAYATSAAPHVLSVIPVSGGPAEVVYSSSTYLTDLSWNPDATKIAFDEDGVGARVLDLANMNVTTAVGLEWGGSYPSWARTQDALVFEGVNPASGVTGLYIKQLPSGTPVFVCAGSQPDWSPTDQALVFKQVVRDGGRLPFRKIELATGIIAELGGGSNPRMPSWRRF